MSSLSKYLKESVVNLGKLLGIKEQIFQQIENFKKVYQILLIKEKK